MPPCPAPSLSARGACPALGLLLCLGAGLSARADGPGPDIYVAGYADSSQPKATVWRNGQPTALGGGDRSVRPLALAVSGQDIYIAGWAAPPELPMPVPHKPVRTAVVWKNGVETRLTDGSTWAVAMAVAVSGTDVYVAGADEERATLWKNGKPATLGPRGVPSWARAVALAGDDVLVAGNAWSGAGGNGVAMIWKNGRGTALTDGAFEACAIGIAVAGKDVYVAGYESNGRVRVAKVWKNGKALPPLSDGRREAEAEAVAVDGATVVAAGYEAVGKTAKAGEGTVDIPLPVATVWKNGAPTRLGDGSRCSWAHAVSGSGVETYVAGEESTAPGFEGNTCHATVWRVGTETPVRTRLSNGGTVANAAALWVGAPGRR